MTVHTSGSARSTPSDTYPEQNLDNDLCQAVVAGDMVYLRGQIGQDLDTARERRHRRRGGAGRAGDEEHRDAARGGRRRRCEHIVKVTVYLIDPRYREAVYRVMGRWLKGVLPGVDRASSSARWRGPSGWWRSTRPRCSA